MKSLIPLPCKTITLGDQLWRSICPWVGCRFSVGGLAAALGLRIVGGDCLLRIASFGRIPLVGFRGRVAFLGVVTLGRVGFGFLWLARGGFLARRQPFKFSRKLVLLLF